MSLSDYAEDKVANVFRGGGNGVTFTAPAAVYGKLHTGDPGEAGTANAAGETTRQEVTFGAVFGGAIGLSNTPVWTNVSTAETITHISLWDNLTAGNCLGSGALDASKVLAVGDQFTLGAFTFTVT